MADVLRFSSYMKGVFSPPRAKDTIDYLGRIGRKKRGGAIVGLPMSYEPNTSNITPCGNSFKTPLVLYN